MPFDSISGVFDAFKGLKVIVVGDVMLDAYEFGAVERMSPESPDAPILSLKKREKRLGGAANVALNLQSLGCKPYLIGPIGDDEAGEDFVKTLRAKEIHKFDLLKCSDRKTTVKKRFFDGGKQILRVDNENDHFLSEEQQQAILEIFGTRLKDANLVMIQDYDKGCLSPDLIGELIRQSKKAGVMVAVDPKKRNFHSYSGVDLFKPNLKEFREGLAMIELRPELSKIEGLARAFINESQIKNLIISLSGKGIFYQSQESVGILTAHKRTILDVSGAGDTVFAISSLCLALGLSARFSAELANLAGGVVCEQLGVVSIGFSELFAVAEKNEILKTELSIS